jgi:hypothetical protein
MRVFRIMGMMLLFFARFVLKPIIRQVASLYLCGKATAH